MSSTDSPLRIAVVGAGLMGRWHAHAARKAGSTVAAVVDRDAQAAGRLASACGGAATFADPAAMLAVARPQIVHVCTPLATHRAIALQAIETGAHVLVEKPLAPTVAETREILAAAQARGVLACPVHQFAFQRGVARAAEALSTLGDALRIDMRICSAGGRDLDPDAMDALVADILPHPLSVLQALWPTHRLSPDEWTAASPVPGEWNAIGRSASVAVGIYLSLNARPPCCEADLFGSVGGLHLDFFHGYCAIRRGGTTRAGKVVHPFRVAGGSAAAAAANLLRRAWSREPAYPGLAELVSRFHAAVLCAGPGPVSPESALEVAAMREHLIAVSMRHQPEATPLP